MPTGQYGFAAGAISDQTLLLQDIRSELEVYNKTIDPWVDRLTEPTIRQTLRVAQAPKSFRQKADGGSSNSSNVVYRLLSVPFRTYDLTSEFTIEWLQDALASDVMSEMAAAIAGDVELVNALFFAALFFAAPFFAEVFFAAAFLAGAFFTRCFFTGAFFTGAFFAAALARGAGGLPVRAYMPAPMPAAARAARGAGAAGALSTPRS